MYDLFPMTRYQKRDPTWLLPPSLSKRNITDNPATITKFNHGRTPFPALLSCRAPDKSALQKRFRQCRCRACHQVLLQPHQPVSRPTPFLAIRGTQTTARHGTSTAPSQIRQSLLGIRLRSPKRGGEGGGRNPLAAIQVPVSRILLVRDPGEQHSQSWETELREMIVCSWH